MQDRQFHKPEVLAFLQTHFSTCNWRLTIPHGSGHETYIARNDHLACFIKLGVQIERYQITASLHLTPPVLAAGYIADGTSILVQPYIAGRNPNRQDYRNHLEKFAAAIHTLHHCPQVKKLLPQVNTDQYSEIGLTALSNLCHKWEQYRPLVPDVADFIDTSLNQLQQRLNGFQGSGLVASHNDICNANWLLTSDGQLFLLDLESMSIDDPALDIGATLWWYYPPILWQKFLQITGHADDPAFEKRMVVRMAMHCLNILLPRPQSFDQFDPTSFASELIDFRAALAGQENPQGYDD